ncbi:MAG: YdcF family protein [Tateyamaria sp.]|nr:YdcF family protein [Tateyamaria sp.]
MDIAFFIIAKIVGMLLRAETWLVIALAVSIIAMLRQRHRTALWVTIVTFVCVAALSVFPVGGSLLARIEQTYPAKPTLGHVNGIIVLGGGGDLDVFSRWGQPELSEGGDRYTAALALAKRHPEALIIFTGGSGALREVLGTEKSESDLAQTFFAAHGISEPRLIIEGQSRNTAENAEMSFYLIQPKEDQSWVLTTSAFHMPRAMRSFETAGWRNVTAYPVDYRTASFEDHTGWNFGRNLSNLNILIRELVGQLAYRLTSR